MRLSMRPRTCVARAHLATLHFKIQPPSNSQSYAGTLCSTNIVHVNTYRDAHKGHTDVHLLAKGMVGEDEEEIAKLLNLCAKFRDSCIL